MKFSALHTSHLTSILHLTSKPTHNALRHPARWRQWEDAHVLYRTQEAWPCCHLPRWLIVVGLIFWTGIDGSIRSSHRILARVSNTPQWLNFSQPHKVDGKASISNRYRTPRDRVESDTMRTCLSSLFCSETTLKSNHNFLIETYLICIQVSHHRKACQLYPSSPLRTSTYDDHQGNCKDQLINKYFKIYSSTRETADIRVF